MTELLRNPQVLFTAKKELKQTFGKGNPIEESDIDHLPYLQAIIKEVFRMYPPAPLLVPRRAESDADISGFKVPMDSQLLVNVWAIGRDPRIWENPNSFIPRDILGEISPNELNINEKFGLTLKKAKPLQAISVLA
ncbi:hypothetical protein F3Y22_tig00116974pilonHSYRG00153 [Hibiscus syriacus]|uniref:Cytochrome P450 n=1 Tax=Hibiscus syriacus TaxID=106335 RepID=A0A6A2WH44_HIBSY|nr:hypothetical protein F3Y22_tig00116974pilonHSYRG00153 [Hibiscus syriacus]